MVNGSNQVGESGAGESGRDLRYLTLPFLGTPSVAIRTDHIALGHLGQDRCCSSSFDHSADSVSFRGSRAMVEIHRAWREPVSAIGAGNRS
jgi:hypothetical protein